MQHRDESASEWIEAILNLFPEITVAIGGI